MGAEFLTFIAALLEHLTFPRLLLLAGLLFCVSFFWNADKLAALLDAVAKLTRRNDA